MHDVWEWDRWNVSEAEEYGVLLLKYFFEISINILVVVCMFNQPFFEKNNSLNLLEGAQLGFVDRLFYENRRASWSSLYDFCEIQEAFIGW